MSAKSKKLVQEKVEALKKDLAAKGVTPKLAKGSLKPEETKKVETKPADQPKPVEVAKAETKPEEAKKAQGKVEGSKGVETKPAEATPPAPEVKQEVPAMPADFCLGDQKYWETMKESLHDTASNDCKSCKTTNAECFKACAVRHAMVVAGTAAKKVKPRGTGAQVTRKSGPTETQRINEMMLIGTKLEEMQAVIAAEFYGNDTKRSASRIKGHIRSVKAGSCISARLFTPEQLAVYTIGATTTPAPAAA